MFQQMIDDHNQIRTITASLRKLLVVDGMPIGRCFATTRWTLTRHLLRHIAVEKTVIGKDVGDNFEQDYRHHVTAWTPDRIDSEWGSYCRELTGLLDTLDRRMAREEREFYHPRMAAAA